MAANDVSLSAYRNCTVFKSGSIKGGILILARYRRSDGRRDRRVAIGSDFDGAIIPDAIKDASGLPNLIAALLASGFDEDSVRKIAFDNWMRVFGLTWRR
jgi:hypothetical protein